MLNIKVNIIIFRLNFRDVHNYDIQLNCSTITKTQHMGHGYIAKCYIANCITAKQLIYDKNHITIKMVDLYSLYKIENFLASLYNGTM